MTRSVSRQVTFAALAADGRRLNDGSIRLTHLPAGHPAADTGAEPAVAFAISRRFGNAVERNRARRRLRAAFAKAQLQIPLPGVFLIGAKRDVLDAPHDDLVSSFCRCFKRLDAES